MVQLLVDGEKGSFAVRGEAEDMKLRHVPAKSDSQTQSKELTPLIDEVGGIVCAGVVLVVVISGYLNGALDQLTDLFKK